MAFNLMFKSVEAVQVLIQLRSSAKFLFAFPICSINLTRSTTPSSLEESLHGWANMMISRYNSPFQIQSAPSKTSILSMSTLSKLQSFVNSTPVILYYSATYWESLSAQRSTWTRHSNSSLKWVFLPLLSWIRTMRCSWSTTNSRTLKRLWRSSQKKKL